jgi:RNA polymerase sigma-70 factor (ECF subfamily)
VLSIIKFSDAKIIDCLNQGGRKENQAIQQLLDDNRLKVKSYVLKNSGNSEDAETILIEGVTELIFNVRKDKFRGESKLSTYLFSICASTWLKKLKKNKRFTDAEDNENVAIDSPSPLDSYNDKQIKEEVNILLGRLGNACEKVLSLWARHYSMTEIANALQYKNAQIAMNKKNKCLTKLKEEMRNNTSSSELLGHYLN